MPQLILASASPRRRELLAQLGLSCQVQAADIDETPDIAESPEHYVSRMAFEKAALVAASAPAGAVVLAADTSVVIDGDVLGKPRDQLHGLAMLARLSGRSHQVMTAICLLADERKAEDLVVTEVTFSRLDRNLCEAYLATDEPWDKAGAYGIQGLGGALVESIKGSYSNVVGLPLAQTWRLLAQFGVTTALGVPP
ncbi:septum formation inhibitor Maf [Parahaliea sp. F7430]|uniref:dTTP/UTP pyrophosphatase n=1 Tax=Sediminihaliea albiluteola TaxID=2758564 RepID=A0A7W2TW37_9GAMM|nr:Maf family protein [Sediminihaliea albiluteola]MBA6413004.1 septum formation inhibitor Maf [Sediminihaliea albiluteola]